MKAAILTGGFGTRLSEEADLWLKPLHEIGGRLIIWRIMKFYKAAGFNEFIICCGYKAGMTNNYFVNYFTENYSLTYGYGVADIDMRKVTAVRHENGRQATVTAVPAPGRFGVVELERKATSANSGRSRATRQYGSTAVSSCLSHLPLTTSTEMT